MSSSLGFLLFFILGLRRDAIVFEIIIEIPVNFHAVSSKQPIHYREQTQRDCNYHQKDGAQVKIAALLFFLLYFFAVIRFLVLMPFVSLND